MTANRWWVRLGARWIARVTGVEGHLRLAMLGVTGISTATLSLQQYGYGFLAAPFVVGVVVGSATYAYLYGEGGVWNQVRRDTMDMSTDFAGPTMRIDDELIARGIIAGQKGESLSDSEREAVKNELNKAWLEYRDGLDWEELDG